MRKLYKLYTLLILLASVSIAYGDDTSSLNNQTSWDNPPPCPVVPEPRTYGFFMAAMMLAVYVGYKLWRKKR